MIFFFFFLFLIRYKEEEVLAKVAEFRKMLLEKRELEKEKESKEIRIGLVAWLRTLILVQLHLLTKTLYQPNFVELLHNLGNWWLPSC